MSDRPKLEQILEVQRKFGLIDAAQVEKDWFVTRALAALMSADKGRVTLVFQGGTALSRAHRLIERMSEDIDLKIVADSPPKGAELKSLRENITAALQAAGFEIDPKVHRKTMWEGSYTKYTLPFKPITEGKGALRPEILIETSVFPVRRPPIKLSVASYISTAYGKEPEVPEIACAALAETAAEKFVALTRRSGAELAGLRKERDPTLVRHIYDLHAIREHFDLADVASLAVEIMADEAKDRAKDYDAYRADPVRETRLTVERLIGGGEYEEPYAALSRDMVYGKPIEFKEAVGTLAALSKLLGK